jgi:capsular polysaccharide transport system permease protein
MPIDHDTVYFRTRDALARQCRVIFALMLRNLRTRFFGHGLGYLIAIGWPLVHILCLVLVGVFTKRAPPLGGSIALFIGVGTVPFMTFSYLSRFMMMSVMTTRPLLAFAEVKVLDVLFASALLEILASCCVTIILLLLAVSYDLPVMPADTVEAACAFAVAVLLGLGFGLLNGVIALVLPLWATVWSLCLIVLYVTSGVLFVPNALPEPLRTVAGYQPFLQVVDWMREAYFGEYTSAVLDRSYAVRWALGATFAGLLIERATRGRILELR